MSEPGKYVTTKKVRLTTTAFGHKDAFIEVLSEDRHTGVEFQIVCCEEGLKILERFVREARELLENAEVV